MKRIYVSLIAIATLASCNIRANRTEQATSGKPNSVTTTTAQKQRPTKEQTPKSKGSPTDRTRVEKTLKEFATMRKKLTKGELILRVARLFIGKPYVAHTLDRNSSEKLVVNLDELDCTTYLENVVAMVLCIDRGLTTFDDFADMLTKIRYRGGKLSYENRLHYFHWWLTDNERMGFVEEISTPNPPFTAVQKLKINYMSQNQSAYDMLRNNPRRVSAIKALEDATNGTSVRYIPKQQLKNVALMRSVVHDGDLIALVTNKKNLDTTHLGIAVWHKDGLHLINASSLTKNGNSVVEPTETLYHYLMARPYNTGIRVARLILPNTGR